MAKNYYQENKEKYKERHREYYKLNKETIKQKQHLRYIQKKEEIKQKTEEYRKNNPEKYAAYRKYFEEKHPLIVLLKNCRARAKQKNIPCNLDLAYLESLDRPSICPVLHIPIDNRDKDHTISLDKIQPELGYVKGNVVFISLRANRLKNDATLKELQLISAYYSKYL